MSAKGYRSSFTTTDGMLTVVVEREASGAPVARFSWVPEDTSGALGELAGALASIGGVASRRDRCRTAPRSMPRKPRQGACEVSMLGDIDQAIELLELGAVRR